MISNENGNGKATHEDARTGLWKRLFKTDARFTKNFSRKGGFSGTDINPTYRMAVMTEEFGPCGIGWGWIIEDRWSECIAGNQVAFVQLCIWYRLPGEDKVYTTGPQIGGTEYGRAPDEAYKMAVTDAMGKCMTSLGLSADIYMRQYDSKYQRDDLYTGQESYSLDWARRLASTARTTDELLAVKRRVRDADPPKDQHEALKALFQERESEILSN